MCRFLFVWYNGMGCDFMNIKEINVLVLAYLGDTVYENYVRKYLINLWIANVQGFTKKSY